MPQLTSAATIQGRAARCFRWPYQANVMKTLLSTSRTTVARYEFIDVQHSRIAAGRGIECPTIPRRGTSRRRARDMLDGACYAFGSSFSDAEFMQKRNPVG